MADVRAKQIQCSITPYHQYIKMKQKKLQAAPSQQSIDHTQKHLKSRQGASRKQNSAQTRSIQNTGKCLTEMTEYLGTEPQDFNHLLSKESNTMSNYQSAFVSVENHNDSECMFSGQADREPSFVHGRSYRCSKKKGDRSTDSKKSETHRSPRNNEGAAHYLLSQILMIVKEFTKFNRERITYMDFLEILRELNMIQPNYEPMKDDYVSQLWHILISGAKENTTCLINFSIIILAVMKIMVRIKSVKDFFADVCYSLDTIRTMGGNTSKRMINREYRRNKEGYFDFSKEDVMQIHGMFKELRVTRMFLGRITKRKEQFEEKSMKDLNYPYAPHISSKSRSLAKLRKSREHHESTTRFQILQQQIKTERNKKQMEQCTFQPNQTKIKDHTAGVKRSDILYRMGKKSKSREKRDRAQDEVDLQRHRQNFTFKPQILNKSRSKSKGKTVEGGSKQIDRMIRARVEKQVKNTATRKGIPFNQKTMEKIRKQVSVNFFKEFARNKQTKEQPSQYNLNKFRKQGIRQRDLNIPNSRNSCEQQPQQQLLKSPSSSQKKRRQIFTFEVYLEQDKCFDGITIYEGDNPDIVAKQFIAKHNLKPELQGKLAKTLTSHLIRILQDGEEQANLGKIEEQSVEYSVQI